MLGIADPSVRLVLLHHAFPRSDDRRISRTSITTPAEPGNSHDIRKAPIAYLVGVAIVGAMIFGGLQWHHGGADTNKDATIENLKSQIAMLTEELKGASPQLAAIHARRVMVREHLLEIYVAAAPLVDRNINKDHQTQDFDKLEIDINEWSKATAGWLEKNLGLAASSRFLDTSYTPIFTWTSPEGVLYPQKANAMMNRLVNQRKNLATIIETAAYDK